MKKYFDHIKTKEPHHRRQHAMQIAGVITAMVFAVWIPTLGGGWGASAKVAGDDPNKPSLSAAAANAYGGPNQLIVAPTNGF